jgi:hypothetical protein
LKDTSPTTGNSTIRPMVSASTGAGSENTKPLRHFYLLAPMVWGTMSARTLAQPVIEATWAAISPRRPARLRPSPLVAARRHRAPSIVGAMAYA